MRSTILLIFFTGFWLNACSSKPDNRETDSVNYPVETKKATKPVLKKIQPDEIIIEKELTYDQYTLTDTYPYKDTTRRFQWEKIKEQLALLETIQQEPAHWGILQNRHNVHGRPEPVKDAEDDEYTYVQDAYGVENNQSIPLYNIQDTITPERYARDGFLVKINAYDADYIETTVVYFDSDWAIPARYIKEIDTLTPSIFTKVIFVDRTNQNIATMEKVGNKWLVRSMNPATTGLRKPPYQRETPLGIFVIQEKKEKMFYPVDGTDQIGGFAPYASRFSNGGYIHGVPVNSPRTQLIEYSNTLGTTPRSHMCVRNATSHAKYIYDWAPVGKTLVVVIE